MEFSHDLQVYVSWFDLDHDGEADPCHGGEIVYNPNADADLCRYEHWDVAQPDYHHVETCMSAVLKECEYEYDGMKEIV